MIQKDFMTRYDNDAKLIAATNRFILEMHRAKRDGVDLAGIFLEVRDKVMLAWVRAFGLMLGIVWIFTCPIMVQVYKTYCVMHKIDVQINEWMYLWPCVVGLVSIIAFGYKLVDPRTLNRLTGKSEAETVDHKMTQSGHFIPFVVKPPSFDEVKQTPPDGADGDV